MPHTMLKTALLAGLMLPQLNAAAQGKKDGPALEWSHELNVTPARLEFKDKEFEGYSFIVHESDDKQAMRIWSEEMKGKCQAIVNGRPAMATGVKNEKIAATPVTMLVSADQEKRSPDAVLTVSYATSDLDAVPVNKDWPEQIRALAVAYNQAVVKQQIKEQEAMLEKAGGKFNKSNTRQTGIRKDLDKAKAKMEKVRNARLRQQAANAEHQGAVVGMEKKFTVTNDPKDLKKLTKARTKLTAGETKVAKAMDQEEKLQREIARLNTELDGSSGDTEGRRSILEAEQQKLEALKRKLAAIR